MQSNLIEPSTMQNDQAEVQKIFAIVKYIIILLSMGQLKLLRNTRFQLQAGAHSTYDNRTKSKQKLALIQCNIT